MTKINPEYSQHLTALKSNLRTPVFGLVRKSNFFVQ
jgi:hypothetical protein